MGKSIQLNASDGHQFDAYVAEPAGKPRGLVIVAPEIFGVNSHIRSVADGFAADGYLTIAPAFFDRAQTKYDGAHCPQLLEVKFQANGEHQKNHPKLRQIAHRF